MKWILLLLLIANVAYATYQVAYQQSKEPSAPPPNASTDGVATETDELTKGSKLVLLGELDDSSLRPRVATPTPSGSVSSGTQESSEDTPSPAPAATEISTEQLDQSKPQDEPVVEATKTPLCIALGPLDEPERVSKLVEWLKARGAQTKVKQNERREVNLFWVHLKPLSNRDAAKAKVNDLETAGVADIYVITRGDMANAISLGVYKQQTSMERRLKELRSKGVEPEVKPRYKTVSATWVEVLLPADEELDEEAARSVSQSPDLNATPCASSEIAGVARITYNSALRV